MIALLVSAWVLPLGASDAPRPFRSGIDLVTLDVCVRDGSGRFLPTLRPEDFLVIENGKIQRITFLEPSDALPLRVVLLIDSSASMIGPKLTRAVDAATQFVDLLEPDDEFAIITFSDKTNVVAPFGADAAEAHAALRAITASGMTALNEALLVAANELGRAEKLRSIDFREVVIVLSDGEDTASVIDFEEVRHAVRGSGALVYAVSLRASRSGQWLGANWPLLQLAADTGGRALGVPKLDALPGLYRDINAEVRHLYRIGYVSSDSGRDGKWRSIAVRLLDRDGRVQTRTGYFAPRR